MYRGRRKQFGQAQGMWGQGEDDGGYGGGGFGVRRSVGGYLDENPDFGGGYSQTDDYYDDEYDNMGGGGFAFGGRGQRRMGNQGGMIAGNQGNRMGGNRRGAQGSMAGRHGGMGGNDAMGGGFGMMARPGRAGGGMMYDDMMEDDMMQMGPVSRKNELVELIKKQSEVINKLSLKLATGEEESSYGYDPYQEQERYPPMMGRPMGPRDRGMMAPGGPMRPGMAMGQGPMRGRPMGQSPMRGGPIGAGPVRGAMRGAPMGARPMRGGPIGAGPMRGGPAFVPRGRGGMPFGGSPGKRSGDFMGDFGSKRPRIEKEKTVAQIVADRKKSTLHRRNLRRQVQKTREEDGSFPPFEQGKIIGPSYIEPVEGFYCELCKKFFKDKDEGIIEHCMTMPHFQKIKEQKFPKEEKKDNRKRKDETNGEQKDEQKDGEKEEEKGKEKDDDNNDEEMDDKEKEEELLKD